ncbi:LuxR C-terminal-related transcriptional regulator [Streptomyces sp. b94]|uniref:LuxR C-terminal-related transcriptional regulator n=1 Tax=Streptomyces sp. b94 TaxID=1827634 RepID=UPI0035AB7929
MQQTSFSSPPVGREAELARRTGVLERARSGEARAVPIAGDAGVGKTRTLDEVAGDRAPVLTARERDVLRLLALGRSDRQTGGELFISARTASVHVSNILAKLAAASRTGAVAIAYPTGPDHARTDDFDLTSGSGRTPAGALPGSGRTSRPREPPVYGGR